MESYELLREACLKAQRKNVARALKLSETLIGLWMQPSGPFEHGKTNPLDRVAQLYQVTGDIRLVQWICQRADGFFVRNPATDRQAAKTFFEGRNVATGTLARFIDYLAEQRPDKGISRKTAGAIRDEWDGVKTVTEGFVRACEHGDHAAPAHSGWLPPVKNVCTRRVRVPSRPKPCIPRWLDYSI